MHARSYQYPDRSDEYIDTTYYDKNFGYLDLGYQRLKIINIDLYPEFSFLKKLFIDHNNLKNLPDPKYLPYLKQLTCSFNKLTEMPLYPKLTFLNIANNQIINCGKYNNLDIRYFDCSHNPGFEFNFYLPSCKHLYINNVNLCTLNLDLIPKLEILDCGNNKLTKLVGGDNLIEINIQSNNIEYLSTWPKLIRLVADCNNIKIIPTYPKLISLTVTYNKLVQIKNQPSLKKIIANNNNINFLGEMPKLKLADLSYNNIARFDVPQQIEYVSLQFNPINNILLSPAVLKTIKELQVNFETYEYVYSEYCQHIKSINIKTNEEKLKQMLNKLSNIFDDKLSEYVFRKFNSIKCNDRTKILFNVTLKLYWNFFSKKNIDTLDKLVQTEEFQYLLCNMTKFYYKTTVITLYFSGYI